MGAGLGLVLGPLLAGWQALVNARPQPLPPEWRAVLAPHFPDLPLDECRCCAPARIPVPYPYVGLALGRTIFLKDPLRAPAGPQLRLVAHELVHVAQFRRLGFWRMCATYGAQLCRVGYVRHPMELEARALECRIG